MFSTFYLRDWSKDVEGLLKANQRAIGTLVTANFTGSADRPVGSGVRSEDRAIAHITCEVKLLLRLP